MKMETAPFKFSGGVLFSFLVLYKAKKVLVAHDDDNKDGKLE